MKDQAKDPKVKLHPDFAVGETVIHSDTGEKHKVIKVTAAGKLKLAGVAGVIEAAACEKDV